VKRHQLTLAPMVIDHIRAQVFHIAEDSIDPALAWEDRLLTAIKNLADFSGYAVDEEASARLGYPLYRLVFGWWHHPCLLLSHKRQSNFA